MQKENNEEILGCTDAVGQKTNIKVMSAQLEDRSQNRDN